MRRQRHLDTSAVEAEVSRIEGMNKDALRKLWREMLKSEPPTAFGPDLLRRSLAYKVQEQAFGGLSAQTKRELAAVIKQISARPSARIALPRRVRAGAVLVRQWKDKVVRVTVLEQGFLYEGMTYPSLSEIASRITGTNWNGPRFFGLRSKAKDDEAPAPKSAKSPTGRPRGRPRKAAPAYGSLTVKAGQ